MKKNKKKKMPSFQVRIKIHKRTGRHLLRDTLPNQDSDYQNLSMFFASFVRVRVTLLFFFWTPIIVLSTPLPRRDARNWHVHPVPERLTRQLQIFFLALLILLILMYILLMTVITIFKRNSEIFCS